MNSIIESLLTALYRLLDPSANNVTVGAPTWVLPMLVLVGLLTVSIIVVYCFAPSQGWVRTCGVLLKVIGVIALAFCLVEPMASATRPEPGANIFACLVDTSQSMKIGDAQSRRSQLERLQRTLALDTTWTTRLEQDFDVRRYTFDTHVRNVDDFAAITFEGNASALGDALGTMGQRFGDRPVAGALLFTDGNATDVEQVIERGVGLGFPIYPVIQNYSDETRDLRIESLTVTQTNFETAPVTLNVAAQHQGMSGEQIVVQLKDETGEVVEEQTRELIEDDTAMNFRFRFRPELSRVTFYRVDVFAEREKTLFDRGETKIEATLENNTRAAMVDRKQGPYRVLYVAGRPNWEFKFLRRALQEDEEVDLVGLIRIAPREPKFSFRDQAISDRNPFFEGFDNKDADEVEQYDQSVLVRFGIEDTEELRDGLPKSADALFGYDAVILDDIEAKYFTPDQMLLLRRFVGERGGGLLMLGGQESYANGGYDRTPIGEILPVYLNGKEAVVSGESQWELSREGWLQSWLRVRSTEPAEKKRLAQMPPMLTVNAAGRVKPGASVLARVRSDGKQHVALATQRFGSGQVGALLVGDLWKWGMHREEDGSHDLLQAWRQTVRWLVSDVPTRVEVNAKVGDGLNDPVVIRVNVRDEEFKPLDNAQVTLKITTPPTSDAPKGESFDMVADASESDAGQYVVNYWPRETGGYRVETSVTLEDETELPSQQAGWTAEPAAEEFARLQRNVELLTRLAEETGGRVVRSEELDRFVKRLPNEKVPVTKLDHFPIWHHTGIMLFALACFCGEWGLRRWKGLA